MRVEIIHRRQIWDILELDSVELYNTQTGQWETTDMKLKEPKSGFGSLTIKLSDIVSKISGQI